MSEAPQAAPARPVQVKLVLLGESAVGKSSVVLRFCQNDFQANKEPTIGAAFLTQRCRLEENVIKFEIWDTAGQERFRSLSPMYYRNAQAAVVVYDVTKAASLDQAKTWVKELQRQANPNIVIALAGNKVDLVRASPADSEPTTPTSSPDDEADDATATPEGEAEAAGEDADSGVASESRRQVPREEAEAYAAEMGLLFFETSAKSGEGVVEVFTEIAKKIPIDHILAATRGPGGAAGRGAGRAGAAATGAGVDLEGTGEGTKDADPTQRATDTSAMRDALKDVVSIRPVENRQLPKSDTSEDIISSYGGDDDDRAPPVPAVKERAPNSTADYQRERERGPTRSTNDDPPPSGSSRRKENSSAKRQPNAPDKKAGVPFDVIDRLDISGLYGGGALMRHDGPFAAATASRNKGPGAPMAAFDPSALAPPTSSASRQPRSNSNLSARAQAALNAMDSEGGSMHDGPYGAAGGGTRALGRRASDSSITMGFPSGSGAGGKGQQLIEIYGVRESEAWEDFGTGRYTPGQESYASSRESVLPPGVSKEDRMGRAQSIWDIEATLRAGKPVGAAPPPMPVIPTEFEGAAANKPKRSKSMAARFRAGRRNPNNPMMADDDDDAPDEGSSRKPLPAAPSPEVGALRYGDGDSTQQANGNVRFDYNNNNSARRSPPRKDSIGQPVEMGAPSSMNRFAGSSALSNTRSLGQEGQPESPQLGRRPSVMQRLFNKKSSTRV
ncbi:hypothetical protein RQP46_005458 [Phenoliferia psychrophenolica]